MQLEFFRNTIPQLKLFLRYIQELPKITSYNRIRELQVAHYNRIIHATRTAKGYLGFRYHLLRLDLRYYFAVLVGQISLSITSLALTYIY